MSKRDFDKQREAALIRLDMSKRRRKRAAEFSLDERIRHLTQRLAEKHTQLTNLALIKAHHLEVIASLLDTVEIMHEGDLLTDRYDISDLDDMERWRGIHRQLTHYARVIVGPHSGHVDCPCSHPLGENLPCDKCPCGVVEAEAA